MKTSDTKPKCWCVGLGRTGTKTFCEALRILGYHVTHNPSFEKLRHLEGGADNGVLIFYKYLDFKFPGSKFVLTMRDKQSWLESVEHICSTRPMIDRDDDLGILRRMAIYETTSFDRSRFEDAYERHHREIRRYFNNRPEDLLEMDIIGGDGWEKLCPFLTLPIPESSFPHLHRRGTEESEPIVTASRLSRMIRALVPLARQRLTKATNVRLLAGAAGHQ